MYYLGVGFCNLDKMSDEYYCDKTDRELGQSKIDCAVFKGANCINNILDQFQNSKERRKML